MMRKLFCMCFVFDTHMGPGGRMDHDRYIIHRNVCSECLKCVCACANELKRDFSSNIGYSFSGQWQRRARTRIINIKIKICNIIYTSRSMRANAHMDGWTDVRGGVRLNRTIFSLISFDCCSFVINVENNWECIFIDVIWLNVRKKRDKWETASLDSHVVGDTLIADAELIFSNAPLVYALNWKASRAYIDFLNRPHCIFIGRSHAWSRLILFLSPNLPNQNQLSVRLRSFSSPIL